MTAIAAPALPTAVLVEQVEQASASHQLPTISGKSSEVVGNRSRDDFPPVTIGNRGGGSHAREIVGGSRKARKGNAGEKPEAVHQESGRQDETVGPGSADVRGNWLRKRVQEQGRIRSVSGKNDGKMGVSPRNRGKPPLPPIA